MKKFIAAVLLMLSFGVAKAHMPKKIHPAFTQKKFVVTGINRLKDYNVPFRFYAPRIIWKQNTIETTVNSIGVEVSQTKIEVASLECLRLRSGTGISFLKNDR